MFQLDFRAKRFKIDKDKFTAAVKKAVEKKIFNPSMRAFIREGLKYTPVDTGMSAGAFMLLAQKFRVKFPRLVRTQDGGRPRFRVRYYDPGSPFHGQFKRPMLGAQLTILGRDKSQVRGGADAKKEQVFLWEGNVLRVRFNTTIRHFVMLFEEWGNMRRAEAAFTAEMIKRSTVMPRIGGFIATATTIVSHAGLQQSGWTYPPPREYDEPETHRVL